MNGIGPIGRNPLAPGATNAAGPDLAEAAQEFESLLLNTMVKAMRASVPRSDLFGDTKHVETYEQLLDVEYSKAMAKQGGFGFAEQIVEQLGGTEAASELRDASARVRAAEESYRAHSMNATTSIPGGTR